MKPSAFEYVRAHSVEDAVAALADHGDEARLLAGGQSLIAMMNTRLAQPSVLVDIGRLADLSHIRVEDDVVSIGALTTHNTVLGSAEVADHCPLITAAYANVAHHTVRNRGTLGGNLCHNDPASEMPLAAALLDAEMVLRSTGGERRVSANDFFVDTFHTAARHDEMLTEIRFVKQKPGEAWAFEVVSQLKGDYAIVAAGCRFSVADGVCRKVRLGFVGAGPTIKRVVAAEAVLEGAALNDDTVAAVAKAAVDAVDPHADMHADVQYKLDRVEALSERVLTQAAARAS
jgi:CO/xanthine dehydrogenase FAD-binding subunit